MANRRTGWLSDNLHFRWREILLHASFRSHVLCPIYCLMPDHIHLLTVGTSEASDQLRMSVFLRRHLGDALRELPGNYAPQKQAYDHVLRAAERGRDALMATARYIAANPVRAGIVAIERSYPYTGCVVPGFPRLDLWADDYWPKLWQIIDGRVLTETLSSRGGDAVASGGTWRPTCPHSTRLHTPTRAATHADPSRSSRGGDAVASGGIPRSTRPKFHPTPRAHARGYSYSD